MAKIFILIFLIALGNPIARANGECFDMAKSFNKAKKEEGEKVRWSKELIKEIVTLIRKQKPLIFIQSEFENDAKLIEDAIFQVTGKRMIAQNLRVNIYTYYKSIGNFRKELDIKRAGLESADSQAPYTFKKVWSKESILEIVKEINKTKKLKFITVDFKNEAKLIEDSVMKVLGLKIKASALRVQIYNHFENIENFRKVAKLDTPTIHELTDTEIDLIANFLKENSTVYNSRVPAKWPKIKKELKITFSFNEFKIAVDKKFKSVDDFNRHYQLVRENHLGWKKKDLKNFMSEILKRSNGRSNFISFLENNQEEVQELAKKFDIPQTDYNNIMHAIARRFSTFDDLLHQLGRFKDMQISVLVKKELKVIQSFLDYEKLPKITNISENRKKVIDFFKDTYGIEIDKPELLKVLKLALKKESDLTLFKEKIKFDDISTLFENYFQEHGIDFYATPTKTNLELFTNIVKEIYGVKNVSLDKVSRLIIHLKLDEMNFEINPFIFERARNNYVRWRDHYDETKRIAITNKADDGGIDFDIIDESDPLYEVMEEAAHAFYDNLVDDLPFLTKEQIEEGVDILIENYQHPQEIIFNKLLRILDEDEVEEFLFTLGQNRDELIEMINLNHSIF
ncbi:hypothetical protein HBN50_10590 [Halobacteriovorax sp. GB3]|uniref:hypothetical protein n=1 Tax=Halobacteriovorax sp. GB3 TaxID=2719615 RepID=UPI00236142A9|nr:hypothetical protein [Halobacteriovorax sp. GB3]MDD0853549.1 hypothetical protein [Halobacteriovorax sp. GB3]